MEPFAFRSIAGLLKFLLILELFSTEILYFVIYQPECYFKKKQRSSCLPFVCSASVLQIHFLAAHVLSVAVVHVSDDPSQIHNDEIILSTERSVYAWHIDLSALLINEVLRWKRWLHDN